MPTTSNKLRIVCLSHDAVETLLALDAKETIVGRPRGCCDEMLASVPTVGGYGNINIDKVLSCRPDVVIAYSDFHHRIVESLVKRHLTVIAQNHTTLAGIQAAVRMIGGLVNRFDPALTWQQHLNETLNVMKQNRPSRTPSVYFEEWPDPLTCGTRWISEIIAAAGGKDIFEDRAGNSAFSDRRVDPEEVVTRNPDIILSSWCGMQFNKQTLISRPGWADITAVTTGNIYEIIGNTILQPGVRIIDGLKTLSSIFEKWAQS